MRNLVEATKSLTPTDASHCLSTAAANFSTVEDIMHATSRVVARHGAQNSRQFRPMLRNFTVESKHGTSSPRPYSELPGPKPLPLLGNMWRFFPVIGTFKPHDLLAWGEDMRHEFGDIVKVAGLPGRKDMVFVFDPVDVENVFRNEGPWPERFILESIHYFRSHIRGDFFQGHQGIANENGENWSKARTVVNQPMMQPRAAKEYVPKIDQVARDFTERMVKLRDDKQELPSDFKNEINKWSLESISLVALDTRLGCLEPNLAPNSDAQRMIDAAQIIFDCAFELDFKVPFWKLWNTPNWRKFVKYSNIFLEISMKYVKSSQELAGNDVDKLSVLQRIIKRDPSTTRATIMAIDMMFAGIDTTSNTSAFLMYHLARNPEKQERLHEELCKFMPNRDEPLTAEKLDAMKYLKACIKESMRILPVAGGSSRTLMKDTVLNNYIVPKGIDVLMFNGVMYRMEKHFPEPERFIPERWLRGEEAARYGCPHAGHKTHPFVFLPFGHGPRQCVGMRFANLEMETLIARVIRNYRLEWHHEDMKTCNRFLVIPLTPLRFKMINRH